MKQNQPLRPAAGVIPVRLTPTTKQVYLVQRSSRGGFFPGFHAFPGGAQEKDDNLVTSMTALKACAVRELFEETGMWPGPLSPSADHRRRLLEEDLKLVDLLAEFPVDGDSLLPAGVRETPNYSPVRFSAQFFMWEAGPEVHHDVWPGELEEGRWWDLQEALRAWRLNEISLAAPTQSALLALHRAANLEEAAADLVAQPRETGDYIPVCPGWGYLALPTPTLPPARHTMCYILGQDKCLVVDPGSDDPDSLARLEGVLGKRVPQAVLFTHHHHDHIGGWNWARQRQLPIWAHSRTSSRLPAPADRLVHDEERLDLGDMALRVLHTPGHAPGHLALFEEERGILLAADLVSSVSTILVEPEEGDMGDYLNSLARCRALRPRLLLPSHGGPMGPGSDLLGRTLSHRLEREATIVEALSDQPRPLEDILPIAYADTAEKLWPMARLALLSHLLKLERERKAGRVGEAWRKI